MRHLDSRYGTNPAIVPGATQKNTNDPSTAPTVLVTPLLPHHAFVFRRTYRRSAANARGSPEGDRQVCLLQRHVIRLAARLFVQSQYVAPII